jgi:hypothetical protein
MKKLLIISLFSLFTVAANAQLFTIFGQEVGFIYVGPKIGGTYSKISNFSDMFPTFTKYRYGYQLGAVGEFGFTSKFSIQTEIEFISKGAKSTTDQRIKMNYIGIPILAKYCFKALGLSKIYAMGGTFEDIRTKGEWVDPGQTSPLGGGFKKYDWGFSFGAGAEYPTKQGIWALDLRYNLGMTDLHSEDWESFKTRSRSFGISLSYKLNLVDLFSKLKNKDKNKESTQGK